MTKDDIFNEILGKEGGYVNNPNDKGGATNWGITEAVARAHGYTGDMKNLTREQALQIYEIDYWYKPNFSSVVDIAPQVAVELADTGVNMGVTVAAKFLQRALNVLTDATLIVDGIIGTGTLNALKQYMQKRDELTLVKALNCLQGARYIELAEQRPANKTFIHGWLSKRVSI